MSNNGVIYLERKNVPKNYDPKGFNFKLFSMVVMSAYLLFIIFDMTYMSVRNIEESVFNRVYIVAVIVIIAIVLGFVFKANKGDKYYQLHIAPSGMIIRFRRGETVLPKKDITNITIERNMQTVIRFYKGDEVLKELNHIYLNHEKLIALLSKHGYPIDDRT